MRMAESKSLSFSFSSSPVQMYIPYFFASWQMYLLSFPGIGHARRKASGLTQPSRHDSGNTINSAFAFFASAMAFSILARLPDKSPSMQTICAMAILIWLFFKMLPVGVKQNEFNDMKAAIPIVNRTGKQCFFILRYKIKLFPGGGFLVRVTPPARTMDFLPSI